MARVVSPAGRLAERILVVAGGMLAFALSIMNSVAGEIENGSIASDHLGRDIPYVVYLPDEAESVAGARRNLVRQGDARGDGRRYPVLYLLHGLGDDETTWLRLGKIRATLDRLIAARELPAMIVVMPRAGRSWYVDDARPGKAGAMFSAFSLDFIAGIEQRYPTLTCRDGRAVGGLSMGGYGAVLAGVTQPDRFRAVISLSGSLFLPDQGDFVARQKLYERIFGGVFGVPPIYARFKAWNVFTRLAAVPEGAPVPDMFLSAGDDDFSSILTGTVRFHVALKRRGLESQLRVIDARHDWANWRGEIVGALKWLGARIAPACQGIEDVRRPGSACDGAVC